MEQYPTRRSILATVVGTGALGLAGCLGGSTAGVDEPSGDWPSFRYDAANTGRNPDATGPTENLEMSWGYDIESLRPDVGPSHVSSPIVLGDRVFVAFDFRVGTGHELGTHVVAIDRETGDEDWLESFEYEPEQGRGATATPAQTLESDGETLFIATIVDEESTLRGLDPETGKERWSTPLGEVLHSAMTVASGSLYAGEYTFAAFDATDGHREHQYEWDGNYGRPRSVDQYPPTVDDDAVYVGVEDTLYAWDRDDGSQLWTIESPFESWTDDGGTWFNQPVVSDDVVYAATGDIAAQDLGGLVAVSSEDGEFLWKTQPDREPGKPTADVPTPEYAAIYGLPIVLEDTICATGVEYGERGLFGIDREDGSIRWFREDVSTIALVAGDDVVYAHYNGAIVAIDPTDGEVLAGGSLEIDTAQPEGQFPAVVDDHLYVATTDRVGAFGSSP
ncbi:PQQ-binding-like beta-propeller repeat protein [Halobacteria archaeon AArc-m2/3/4]|uniref:PQQ-binding-like beta-propeller repeat protein n=1 Tax=Natronoglomus mannanivorans TaxID=2979990 RepID=A0ABT2QHT7_9EURY|nr:PQQ-binding-like beta-propeller repeat protein [Halobacteria archaeon AArc-m2/3/4]